MSNLKFSAPAVFLSLLNAAGHKVGIPHPPFPSADIDGNQWIAFQGIPSNTTAGIDPIAGTTSGLSSPVVDQYLSGFSVMAQAFHVSLTASKVDPSVALLDNTVSLITQGREIAHLTVSAAAGRASSHLWTAPDGVKGDSRVALAAAGAAITAGSFTASNEKYSHTSHGLITGQQVLLNSLTGGTGLTAGLAYWFFRLDADNGYFCSSYANALAGVPVPIDVTLDATTVSVTPKFNLGLSLSAVDPNLLLTGLILGANA